MSTASSQPKPSQLVDASEVAVRRFPWPYRGMLAICSDIDNETPAHFAHLHRFLNTKEMTVLGEGLGLDIANSFWFYAPDADKGADIAELAFFNGMTWHQRSQCADQIVEAIRGGWIDTLHTYGYFDRNPPSQPGGFSREHAERALAVLEETGVAISVWSNHGNRNNIQNIGGREGCHGDDPEHPGWHSDLMSRAGISFVWSGVMSGDFRRDTVVEPVELRDGRKVWQFSRQDFAYREDAEDLAARFDAVVNPSRYGPLAVVWHPQLLHIQLSPENLAELAVKGGYAIIGQHLGYTRGRVDILPDEAVDALRRLKAAQDAGDILVARTSRLLEYSVSRDHLRFEAFRDAAGKTVIDVLAIDDPVRGVQPPTLDGLRGVTFEVAGPGHAELCLRGQPLPGQELVEHRIGGRSIIGIRWFATVCFLAGPLTRLLAPGERVRELIDLFLSGA